MTVPTTPERAFCDAAHSYLLTFSDRGVTPGVLEEYLEPGDGLQVAKISDIYWQLLWSSQNANMRTAVVTGSMDGGMMALTDVLFGFEPAAVLEYYGDDSEKVLDVIVERVRPRGQVRRSPRSVWPQFCKSVVSGAKFLAQFSDANAFYVWADRFDAGSQTRADLPVAISEQVSGLGFALSCDFLKELGYSTFGKPDVHIRKILIGLGLMSEKATDREAFESLLSFSQSAELSAYHVDKLMWLVGSGNFYQHSEIGHVSTDRDGFAASQRSLFTQA